MGSHIMKTTIEIADDLFASTQRLARKEKTTFRALTEEGLRLNQCRKTSAPSQASCRWFHLRRRRSDAVHALELGSSGRDLPGAGRMIAVDTNLLVYSLRPEEIPSPPSREGDGWSRFWQETNRRPGNSVALCA